MRITARVTIATATLVVLLVAATPAVAGFEDNPKYRRAMKQFYARHFAEAAEGFGDVAYEHPDWSKAHYWLGVSLLEDKRPGEAEQPLQQAVDLDPENFTYYRGLATAYAALSDHGQTIATLDAAEPFAEGDESRVVYEMRADSLIAEGRWSRAIDDLERSLEIKAEPGTLLLLGQAYLAEGLDDEAAATLREAVRLDPKRAEGRFLLAEALIRLAQDTRDPSDRIEYYEQALDAARESVRLSPDSVDARFQLGRAALGARVYDEAREAYTSVLEQDAGNCAAIADLGRLELLDGKTDEAMELLRDGIECDPDLPSIADWLEILEDGVTEEVIGEVEFYDLPPYYWRDRSETPVGR